MTKLGVNGRASKDSDEWTEEVRAHCEKCHDDKIETPEVQAERIRYQRSRGDSLTPVQGRRIRITVDRVLHARGKMTKNKAKGPADCLLTEMLCSVCLWGLCTRSHIGSRGDSEGSAGPPEGWKVLRLVFLKKPEAKLEKGLRGFRAIALLSVFSKWYTTVLVYLLHEEEEPIEWKSLHVGAERGVNCEHMQALLTNILHRHWEGQEDHRIDLEPGFFK